jgi:hypothetical protein
VAKLLRHLGRVGGLDDPVRLGPVLRQVDRPRDPQQGVAASTTCTGRMSGSRSPSSAPRPVAPPTATA